MNGDFQQNYLKPRNHVNQNKKFKQNINTSKIKK